MPLIWTARERSTLYRHGRQDPARGSFDHFEDRKAAQVLSALATECTLVLGHVWITDEEGEKHHEIQAAQQLIETLGLSGRLFTLDALHTQKKPPSS
ncbi:hypothetical protein [Nitrococcus mobilis]|uniref:ISMca6, transposase, OrfA n=1 Tax=Nitrococcus mobilis Nb-231 TaxID=314278 RepID=A4BNG0_9GAMM|nr:hypothetical protein [Nitrococcus mobilis]EAR22759.1 ISMca6, transposase, OrfA [Nitrococcus mobilis Nb-231]